MAGTQSLSKEFRLNQPKAIRLLFSAPKIFQEKEFWLRARDDSRAFPRLAMVIPKKRVPLAVHRNYLKRLVRESFRKHRSRLPPWDFLFYWTGVQALRPERELYQVLDQAWASIGSPN